ncbi:MAG: hypothetical protein ACOC3V_04485 [bacterium]
MERICEFCKHCSISGDITESFYCKIKNKTVMNNFYCQTWEHGIILIQEKTPILESIQFTGSNIDDVNNFMKSRIKKTDGFWLNILSYDHELIMVEEKINGGTYTYGIEKNNFIIYLPHQYKSVFEILSEDEFKEIYDIIQ